MQAILPIPSAEEQSHSQKLLAAIAAIIQESPQQIISFARYMELALYMPALGYYMADHPVFGWTGDFTTAPELSPVFAQCLARPCLQVLEHTGGDILEIGAGSGKLAAELLQALPELPTHYYIYEISPALRQRQQNYMREHTPYLFERVVWLEQLPESFVGFILANEVIDALPAECFSITPQGIMGRGVALKENKLQWEYYPAPAELSAQVKNIQAELSTPLPLPYNSELQMQLSPWITKLSQLLKSGVILLCDYGFPRREYYHPDRHMGTLMCHYKQHAHMEPFWYPGLQDITVHVDFTAVAQAALNNNLDILGYTSQAQFLLDSGLIEIVQTMPELNYATKHQIQILTSPAEMGELFKVMGLTRGCDIPLAGLTGHLRSWAS